MVNRIARVFRKQSPMTTIVLPFNDIDAVRTTFRENKDQIACVILEPIPANAGLFFPREDFLHQLRVESAKNGALLIFDEVMTGFRVARGGAQHAYGIRPDLTTLGKVIGGGLPVGVFGAARRLWIVSRPMDQFTRRERCPEIRWQWQRGWLNYASSHASMAGNYSSNSEHNWRKQSATSSQKPRSHFIGSVQCSAFSSPAAQSSISIPRDAAIRNVSLNSFMHVWSAGFISRRHSSRRILFRRRIRRLTSRKPRK